MNVPPMLCISKLCHAELIKKSFIPFEEYFIQDHDYAIMSNHWNLQKAFAQ
jgi:hypothetical protein